MTSSLSKTSFPIFVLYVAKVNAHVRWFVADSAQDVHFSWGAIYSVLLLCAVVYGLLAYKFEMIVNQFALKNRVFRLWPVVNQYQLVAIASGVTLLCFSWSGIFIAPNLPAKLSAPLLLWLQALCGLVMLLGNNKSVSGVAVMLMALIATLLTPLAIWMDYAFEFGAIALFLLYQNKSHQTALFFLRVGVGAQLMVLAVHNKLLNPALGLSFLASHDWNFMQLLGFEHFDNLLFVFSAGVAEFTFGLLIFAGLGFRTVVFTLSGFFLTTAIILGLGELLGHIPIIACALALLTLGGGRAPFGSVLSHAHPPHPGTP